MDTLQKPHSSNHATTSWSAGSNDQITGGTTSASVTSGTVSFVPAGFDALTVTTAEHAATPPAVSTSDGSTHITIIPTFDSSVTNAGGTITSGFESAVNTAIQFFENEITNPITITIGFGWGENGGTLMPDASGASSMVTATSVDWTSLYNAVGTTDTTSTDQLEAAASLPSADPTGGAGTFFIAPAEQLALGLVNSVSSPVGTVGLSVDTYNWSETGTQNPDGSDAVSEFEHEISEVMGRTDYGGAGNDYTLLDMFRYTSADGMSGDAPGSAAGARDEPFQSGYNANAFSYFSVNGGTVLLQYDTPTEVGGGEDIADWTSTVSHDSFDGAGGPGEVDPVSATDLREMNVLGYDLAVCFMAGTHIATPAGPVAVESLRPGDLVRTADGEVLPVRFVGVQTVVSRFADALRTLPVRIRAGALAEQVPSRDLVLSPSHAVLVDGVLAHAGALVNGTGIVRETAVPERFGYWHVELDRHTLLLAEGCAAESYLEVAEPVTFDNAAERPDRPQAEQMPNPRAKSARQVPLAIRARLAARGARLVGMAELAAVA
jgi:hypothetical protein